MRLIPLLLVAAFLVVLALLFFLNTCKIGGIGGLNECNCQGLLLLKSRDKFVDGFETYSCIGILK
jgi:hypothetical protein